SSVSRRLLRSAPIRTLSLASSKSYISTDLRLLRAAFSAASFTMLESSAPEKPGVPRARIERSTSSAGEFYAYARGEFLHVREHREVEPQRGGRSVRDAAEQDRARQAGWSRRSESRPHSIQSHPSPPPTGSGFAHARHGRRPGLRRDGVQRHQFRR